MSAKVRSLNDFLMLLKGIKQLRDGQYIALCPGHHDTKPSLSIKEADSKILLQCFAGCELAEILKPLGLAPKDLFLNSRKTKLEHREIEAIYHYMDASGKPFEVVRTRPKGFYQRQPDGKGGYINNLDGIMPTLYHQSEIIPKAITHGDTIHIPEGEADCDRLWGLGLVATCNSGGAGKWRDSYSNTLAGAKVVVLPDNDQVGKDHAQQIAQSLYGRATNIKILELPNLSPKGDVSDWLDNGGTADELEALVNRTSLYIPQVKHEGMLPLNVWRQQLLKDPPVEDIIQDLLPNASTEYLLLCGRAGIGKTNVALYLGFCLATGTPFFSLKTKRSTVGYLGFEGTPRKILARFDKLQKTFGDPGDFLKVDRSLSFKLTRQSADNFAHRIEGLDIVIVDPLRYMVPDDYTKPEVASTFIATLKECCDKSGAIAILLHHVRKPDRRLNVRPEDLAYEVKGATEYVDSAATVLLLERARQPRAKDGRFGSNADDRTLHFCKVKDAPAELPPLRLRFNRETLIYEPLMDYEPEDDEFS